MQIIYKIKDRMEEELKELCKKETWTGNDVDLIGAMIDVVKDVETIEAMKDYQPEDWMRSYSRGYDEDYSMTRAPYNRHDDYSYARGRDAMGRYTSRDDGKQEMINHLNTMMMNARTPEERESYRSAIEHMSRN